MATIAEQLAAKIEAGILSGERPPGSLLPSLSELVKLEKISKNTAVTAMDLLESRGLIERRRGAMVTVRAPKPMKQRTAVENYIDGWTNIGEGLGVAERAGLNQSSVEITCEIDVVDADADLGKAFRIPEGEPLLRQTFHWERARTGTEEIQLTTTWFVESLAALNPEIANPANCPWPGGSEAQLHSLGVQIGGASDHLTARPPTSIEEETLDLDPGVAVLCIRKIVRDTHGQVVEVTDSVHPGDTTEAVYNIPVAHLIETEGEY